MARKYSIEEVCGSKQIKSEGGLVGKNIVGYVSWYNTLYLVFSDRSFVCITASNEFLELEGIDIDFQELVNAVRPSEKGKWTVTLTELGELLGADLEKLDKLFNDIKGEEERVDDEKEYKEYLRLKEKFRDHDKSKDSNI